MHLEHQVVIACSPSRAFEYMDDVSREREWQPSIVEAFKDPPGETAVGTQKRYLTDFMGRRIQNTYVTTLFDSGRRVKYETTPDSVVRAKVDLRFDPEGDGTRVTMVFEGKLTGPLRFIPRKVLEGVYHNELKTTLTLLKQRLEGEG